MGHKIETMGVRESIALEGNGGVAMIGIHKDKPQDREVAAHSLRRFAEKNPGVTRLVIVEAWR
jgi:hypothetical protein